MSSFDIAPLLYYGEEEMQVQIEREEIMKVTLEEKKLLEIVRNIQFGEARIVVNDGKPTRIEEIKKSIKL